MSITIFYLHIYRKFLQELETCGDDPVQVAQCFVKNNDGFKIYAEYCTNYPRYQYIMYQEDILCHLLTIISHNRYRYFAGGI